MWRHERKERANRERTAGHIIDMRRFERHDYAPALAEVSVDRKSTAESVWRGRKRQKRSRRSHATRDSELTAEPGESANAEVLWHYCESCRDGLRSHEGSLVVARLDEMRDTTERQQHNRATSAGGERQARARLLARRRAPSVQGSAGVASSVRHPGVRRQGPPTALFGRWQSQSKTPATELGRVIRAPWLLLLQIPARPKYPLT